MQLVYGIILTLFIVNTTAFASPGDELVFRDLPAFNQRTSPKWSPSLTDIIQHMAPGDSNNYDDRITLGHETSHGIHSYIRNRLNTTGRPVNGFYVLNDQAVIVPEPPIRKRQVAPYVPQSLRGSRYSVYVTGASDWDDRPLYIWDEWVAYTNGGIVGVELVEAGLWGNQWRDGVAGQLEFVAYAVATAMATKELAPAFFNSTTQFREFLAFNLKRCMDSFFVGRDFEVFRFGTQDKLYNNLATAADAEKMRVFLRDTFGADWVLEVMKF